MINTFSIKEAITYGWETTKKHFWLVVGFSFVFELVLIIVQNLRKNFFGGHLLFMVVSIAVGTLIEIGYYQSLLRITRGETPVIKDMFQPGDIYWDFLLTRIFVGVIVIVGFVLLIIPGLYFAMKYFFWSFVSIEKKTKPKETLVQSALLTKDIKGHLFLFALCLIGINILGAICLGVGTLVSIPVSIFAVIFVYQKLSSKAPVSQIA